MHLNLRPELQKFIYDKVNSGEYSTAQEVVEAGLARLMLDAEPAIDDQTLADLEAGEAEIDRGDFRPRRELRTELLARYLRE